MYTCIHVAKAASQGATARWGGTTKQGAAVDQDDLGAISQRGTATQGVSSATAMATCYTKATLVGRKKSAQGKDGPARPRVEALHSQAACHSSSSHSSGYQAQLMSIGQSKTERWLLHDCNFLQADTAAPGNQYKDSSPPETDQTEQRCMDMPSDLALIFKIPPWTS